MHTSFSDFPKFDLSKAFEQAKEIEEMHARFKGVVGISVSDALSFYCATGDLPTYEQIQYIKTHGIKAVHDVISRTKR